MIRKILAVLTAALIATLMGGGMSWAGEGEGHTPVNVCHATSSDSNPYVFITVDDDSVKFKGHLMHRDDPNKTWKSDGVYNSVVHQAGDPKADLISDYTDSQGVVHTYDGTFTNCDDTTPVQPPADVVVTTEKQLSCENGVENRTVTTTTEFIFVDGEWVADPDTAVVTFGDWTFVRDLTNKERLELQCDKTVTEVVKDKERKVNCDGVFTRTITTTTVDGEVTDVNKSDWTEVRNLTHQQKVNRGCIKPPEPNKPNNPDKPGNPVAQKPELPHTGINPMVAVAGLGMLGAGSALMFAARRRKLTA